MRWLWAVLLLVSPVFAASIEEEIWQTQRRIDNGNYTVDRGLSDYKGMLGPRFSLDLWALPADAHWIDIGAGEALAGAEYLCHKPGLVTAVTIEGNRGAWREATDSEKKCPRGQNVVMSRLIFRSGRPIEDYALRDLGPADLITDLYGAASYSPTLDKVFSKIGELLTVDGRAYVLLRKSRIQIEPSEQQGYVGGLEAWLNSFDGMKARLTLNVDPDPPRSPGAEPGDFYVVILEKTAAQTRVPPLELTSFKDAGPPYRTYRR